MTSGELLKQLLRNYKRGNHDAFAETVMQIISEEKRKNHHVLADDLVSIIGGSNGTHAPRPTRPHDFSKLPRDGERGTLLLEVRSPSMYLGDIVLSGRVRRQVDTLLKEYRDREVLKTYGLHPKSKLLLAGPPGCGKTLCTEVIAGELGLPILYTRFDAVVSSYLGETSANLRKVFDYASGRGWVLFFDEFDAIGKSRNDLTEHGELKRVVNTFLQLLDSFTSDSLVIAATNHEQLLDRALWRRFDDIIYFDRPSRDQIPDLVHLKLTGFRHQQLDVLSFVEMMQGWSHADIERACVEAMKMSVMACQDTITDAVFREAVDRQTSRAQMIRKTTIA